MPGPTQESSDAEQTRAQAIEVVLFDYGMVLSGPPDPEAWTRMKQIAALSEEQLHDAYWAFRHDYDRGALGGREYWREVARRTGITLNEAQIDALIAADLDLWARPNPPMIAWAARLQRAGMRTAILSNIGDAMAEGMVARLAWLDGFELCIWSHALSLAKPDPAIFVQTVKALGTPAASILFIDDKEENVVAAATAGMRAVRYTTHAEFEQTMRKLGLASLLEVGLSAAGTPGTTAERAGHPHEWGQMADEALQK
jgi:putative hydrolase of the HAD superfamily